MSHFGPPTAPEQDGVGLAAGGEDLIGEGDAVLVDRDPADQSLVELELAEALEQAAGGADDLSGPPRRRLGQDDTPGVQ